MTVVKWWGSLKLVGHLQTLHAASLDHHGQSAPSFIVISFLMAVSTPLALPELFQARLQLLPVLPSAVQ